MAQTSFRVAVGGAAGRRSTVWKFVVQGNEVYILSRMFGSDVKVSLHGDGRCQYSMTDAWMKKNPGTRNAERHMERWRVSRPFGNAAVHAFRVWLPHSELSAIDAEEDLSGVEWLDAPPLGASVALECYFTPSTEHDPCLIGSMPFPVLFRTRLLDGRWFVVLHHVDRWDGATLHGRRELELKKMKARGYVPKPHHRGAFFSGVKREVRGLIEMLVMAPQQELS